MVRLASGQLACPGKVGSAGIWGTTELDHLGCAQRAVDQEPLEALEDQSSANMRKTGWTCRTGLQWLAGACQTTAGDRRHAVGRVSSLLDSCFLLFTLNSNRGLVPACYCTSPMRVHRALPFIHASNIIRLRQHHDPGQYTIIILANVHAG